MIKLNCPECSTAFKVIPEKLLGVCSGLLCPSCGKYFLVPIPLPKPRRQIKKYATSRYRTLRAGAIKRGIPFLIAEQDFLLWWNTQEDTCHFCGISIEEYKKLFTIEKFPLKFYRGIIKCQRMTVDRLDSSKGYQAGNIVKACYTCNPLKSYLLTEDEAKIICPIVMKRLRS